MIDNTEWLKTRVQRLDRYLGDANFEFNLERYPEMAIDGDTCTMTFEYKHAMPNKMAKVTVRFEDIEFPYGTTVDVYTTIDGHTEVCNREMVSANTGDTIYKMLEQTKEEMKCKYKGRVPAMVLECVRRIRFGEILGDVECMTAKGIFEEAARELNRLKIPEIEMWLGGFPEEVRMDILRYAVNKRYRLEDEGWDEFNEWLME